MNWLRRLLGKSETNQPMTAPEPATLPDEAPEPSEQPKNDLGNPLNEGPELEETP